MKKENQNIDEYFKKKLDQDVFPEGWNVPSDEIFSAAISDINAAKGNSNRRKLFILFIVLFGLSLFSIYGYNYWFASSNNSSISSEDLQIAEFQTKIETLESEVLALKNAQTSEGQNASTESQLNQVENNQESSHTISGVKSKNEIIQLSQTENYNNRQNFTTNEELEERSGVQLEISTEIKDDSSSDNANFIVSLQDDQNDDTKWNSSLLSRHRLELLSRKYDPKKIVLTLPSVVENNKESIDRSDWSIQALTGINLSWMAMDNIPVGEMDALTEYDQAHVCTTNQLSLVYEPISRWNFNIDLGFSRYLNRSVANYNLFFQEDQVSIDNQGYKRYETEVEMMNPVGSYGAMIRFDVEADMQQNELIKESINTTQQLDYLSLGLSANYTLLNRGNWNLYGGLGATLWQNIRTNSSFEVSLYMKDELKYESIETTNNLSNVNSRFVSLSGQVGAIYDLTSSLSLIINTTYQHGITSIRNSSPAPGPQTFLHALQPLVGVRYKL